MTSIPPSISIIDFDDIASGEDINGMVQFGARFVQTGAALRVVTATATYTPQEFFGYIPNIGQYRLVATSGSNVLSPGGPELGAGYDPAVENDGVEIVFDPPVGAFGFDHLSQSQDGASYTWVQVLGASNSTLYSGTIPVLLGTNAGGPPLPGSDFWGIVTPGSNGIFRVVIDERDADSGNPDCNIGMDTIRIGRFPGRFLPSTVVVSGSSAPAVSNAVFKALGSPSVNAGGQIAFVAEAKVLADKKTALKGIWLFERGVAELVALQGDHAPGLSNAVFSAFGDPVVTDGGDVVHSATASRAGKKPSTTRGIWRWHEGASALIAKQGDPAAGLAGATLSEFRDVVVFADDTIVVHADAEISVGKKVKKTTALWKVGGDGVWEMIVSVGGSWTVNSSAKTVSAISIFDGNEPVDMQNRNHHAVLGTLVFRLSFTDGTSAIIQGSSE